MLRTLLLIVTLGVANATLYAQCDKCCGDHIVEAVSHRDCYDDEPEFGLCHVTECTQSSGGSGCCWSIFGPYNDVCTPYGSGDAGLHSCGL